MSFGVNTEGDVGLGIVSSSFEQEIDNIGTSVTIAISLK